MKHRPLLFLVLPLLLLAMMLASVRMFSGSDNTASAAARQVALDLVEDTGWCNTINNTDTVSVGAVHKAAICIVGAGTAVKDFDVVVNFNTAVNNCSNTGQTGAGLDANPDFVGQGTGFNCSLGGLKYPYCKINNNEDPPVTTSEAFITCGTTNDPGTVAANEPIAIITWTATFTGVDNLSFGVASFSDINFEAIVECPSANCLGATVTKSGGQPPANTATPTATPTATATPTCGGIGQEPCATSTPTAKAKTRTPTPEATGTPAPGEPTSAPPPPPPPPSGGQQPVVVPPATGTGSGGIGWTGMLLWTLTGGAAFSLVLGGGLYLRRATNR
jgi:hypothetical protein